MGSVCFCERVGETRPVRDLGTGEGVGLRVAQAACEGVAITVLDLRREFARDRCLVLADGFYEFTVAADPKQKKKDCWLFRPADGQPFAIAGVTRNDAQVGEAFTLLTVPPGPDIAPYHNRQIALLSPPQWRDWLDGSVSSKEMLRPAEAGELSVSEASSSP